MINAMEANDLMPSTQEFHSYYVEYMKIIEQKIIDAAKKDQHSTTIRIPSKLQYSIKAALEEAYYECYTGESVMEDGVYTCALTIFWGV